MSKAANGCPKKVRLRESRDANSPAVPEAGGVLSPWSQTRARGEPGLRSPPRGAIPGVLGIRPS